MYEFYSTRCWFIYNLLVVWRICGKAGKHFTSRAQTPKTQIKPETRACLTQKKKKPGNSLLVSTTGLCQKRPPPPGSFL